MPTTWRFDFHQLSLVLQPIAVEHGRNNESGSGLFDNLAVTLLYHKT